MNYIVDTHCFLWSAFSPEKLSKTAKAIILDPGNDIYVSAVTFWEISLKYAIGKLDLDGVDPTELTDVADKMGFELIPLGVSESSSFFNLLMVGHKDPFDRMLVWQAIKSGKVLVSKDTKIYEYEKYGLKVVW